jgi:hypothetical protein
MRFLRNYFVSIDVEIIHILYCGAAFLYSLTGTTLAVLSGINLALTVILLIENHMNMGLLFMLFTYLLSPFGFIKSKRNIGQMLLELSQTLIDSVREVQWL